MKILVLGGAGIAGRAAVRELAKQTDVSRVVIGDVNVQAAEHYLAMLNDAKVSYENIDAGDYGKLVKEMKKFDCVVNCVYYSMLMPVTSAAIEAKVHIVDLGGFYYGTMKQMDLSEEARKAGITMLHGCGAGPGITNVVARYGAERLDIVKEIHIRAMGVAPAPGSPQLGKARLNMQAMLDEFTMNPVVFEKGQYKEVPPLTGREMVEFPEPVGLQPTYYTLHSEPLTLGKYIKGLEVADIKIVIPDSELEKAQSLIHFGLTGKAPVNFRGHSIIPREFLESLLSGGEEEGQDLGSEICATVIRVSGEKGGNSVTLTYEYVNEQERRWGNDRVGIPLAIGTLMIGRGVLKKRGFTVPEESLEPSMFIEELKERGFHFREIEHQIRDL